MEIRRVAVIGAGTMGHGIAELFAMNGFLVSISDISDEILRKALDRISWSINKLYSKGRISESPDFIMSRIRTSVSIEEVCKDADFVIEAVPERMEVKKAVLERADMSAPKHAIIASNTSSLPISELASFMRRSERFLGMHFFNPPVLMKLVEIVRGKETSEDVVEAAAELAKKLGKTPVVLRKDVPGFIVNRILVRIMNTACMLVHKGVHSVNEVDSAVVLKLGFPMGIFELADYSGVDVFYYILKAVKERGVDISICPLMEELFQRKKLGVKKGEGFYKYPDPGKYVKPELNPEAAQAVDECLLISPGVNEAACLLMEEVASKEDIDTAVKLGLGYPKGIFEYADEFGIGRVVASLMELKERLGSKEFAPASLLMKMLKENKVGKVAGQGFYDYISRYTSLSLDKDYERGIAILRMNRPEKLNAVTMETLDELERALDELDHDEKVRVIIITGSGRAFCAGADVSDLLKLSPFDAMKYSMRFQRVAQRMESSLKPVIVAINGYCLGGGMEIALGADVRIACESAKLGQPEVNLGIMPGGGATQRLHKLVGRSKACRLMMTGDLIGAREAGEMGLVDEVVPDEELMNKAVDLALKLAEKPSLSLAAIKTALRSEKDFALESSLFGLIFSTQDSREGVKAFLEKRKAKLTGK